MQTSTIRDLEARIGRWHALSGLDGDDDLRANSGANRTEEKRALLRAIAENAAERGRPFPRRHHSACDGCDVNGTLR